MEDASWPAESLRADFLAGNRVVEISTRAAGAYAGRLLYLLGADVVRLDLGTTYDCPPEDLDLVLRSIHEGKQTVDFAAGHVADEVARADLLVVDSLYDDGLDGQAVAATTKALGFKRPETSVVDLSAFRTGGVEDPVAPVGTSLTASARAAMSWAIGSPDRAPLTLPFDLPDYLTGTEAAAAGALALLLGNGSDWSVASADVLAYYVGQICSNFVAYERPWHRDGARATQSGGSYPAAMFPCRDGWMSVMCRTQPEWHGLVAALGEPDWLMQERYRDSRVVARLYADELDPVVEKWTRGLTRDEVFSAGREHGFPVAPVLTVDEALREAQFAHRAFFVEQPLPDGTHQLMPGSPYRVESPPRESTGQAALRPLGGDPRLPLAGLTVLDLSWVWSGPMVSGALVDLGATVIKVENSKRADPARLRGRALRNGEPLPGPELEVTPYFNQLNRGKMSVEIDMATEEGADLIRRLSLQADVVVENMRPGVLAKRGLDYATLSADHPELVMVSLSMLGQTGPLSGIRGYAVVMSGLAGLDSLVGYDEDHLIGTFNPALGDPNGAAHALAAVLAGLVKARRTGSGAWIDVSQVEALLSILRVPVAAAQAGQTVRPPANGHATAWPHDAFETSEPDGWVAVAARTDRERAALASAIGHGDPTDRPGLQEALAAWVRARKSHDVVDALTAAGIPVSAVARYEDMRVDPGLEAIHQVTHPWLGPQDMVSLPWRQGASRFRTEVPAPELGSSTSAVLTRFLDLSESELSRLRSAGVIGPVNGASES